MKKLSLSFLLLFAISSFAQTEFTRVMKDDSTDQARSMFQASNGDYFLLSTTNSFGQGGLDVQITRTNGLGDVTWSYTYGTGVDDIAYKINPTFDGGALVAGKSAGFGNTGVDAFLMKINGSGTVQWTKSIRSDSTECAYDAIEARNGDIYMVGTIDLDSFNNNIFLARLSSTGSFSWVKTYGGAGNEQGYALGEDKKGNIVIVGSTDYDSVNIGSTGDMDAQVIVTNTGGAVLKHKNFGTTSNDLARAIDFTNDGDYLIAGNTEGGTGTGYDAFLAVLDTTLAIDNAEWFGTFGADSVYDVDYQSDGTMSLIFTGQAAISVRDVILVQTFSGGGITASNTYGGFGADGRSQAAVSYVNSIGLSVFGSGESPMSNNNEDLFLTKVDDNLSNTCIGLQDNILNGVLNLSSNAYMNSGSVGGTGNAIFTRSSNTNDDTTFCCKLEARVAGDSFVICTNDELRIGRSAISGYTYTWSAEGSSWTSSSANPTVSPTSSTTYKLFVSSSDGACTTDSAEVYVKVNARQTIAPLADTFFCEKDSVILTAVSGMNSYTWQGKTLYNTQSIKLRIADTLVLSMIDANSCLYTDTIGVEIRELPTFDLGEDTTICENLSITLFGPFGGVNYKWNGVDSGDRFLITSESRIHTLEVTDAFGCKYSDQIQILTNPASTIDLGNDTSFCEGTDITIFGPTSLSDYKWNDTASSSASLTVSEGGTYWLEAYNSFDCPAFDTITVTQIAAPEFSLGNDTGYCDEVNVQLQGPANMDDYLWHNGSSNETFNATGPGTYYLTVTNSDDCSYTDTIHIDEFTSPSITLGPDTAVIDGKSIELTPGTGYADYDWSTGATTSSITVTDSGSYHVTVTDDNGCTDSDTVMVRLKPNSIVYLNGVSYTLYPNPATDFLNISTEGNIVNSRVELFNVEGKMVYSTIAKSNHIEINVSELPEGLYYLTLTADNNSLNFKVMID